ncbi:MAG: alpha/beta fold hydrolase [Pseudomonadota bacterium]
MKSFAKWLLVAMLPTSIAVAETSVEDFVKLPSFGVIAMSPDGKHLAATTDVKGDAAMIVMNIENPKKPDVILRKKAAKGQSIASIGWVSDERLLFTTNERNGTLARPIGGGVVYAVDYNGKNEFRLGSGRSYFSMGQILDLIPDDPYHILIVSYGQGRGALFERVNVVNGRRNTTETSPFDNGNLLGDAGNVARFATGSDESDNIPYYAYRASGDDEWETFESPFQGGVFPVSFEEETGHILMATNDENSFGMGSFDPVSREYTPMISHDKVPANELLYGPDGSIVGAEFLPGLPEVQYLPGDSDGHLLWKRLHGAFPDYQVRIEDYTLEGDQALVRVWSDVQPPRYFLLDTEAFTARYLFDTRPEIDGKEMRPKTAHWLKARDGVDFQVYVTKPEGEGPFPTVMVIHGGPHGPRDEWGYDLEAQLLASRGYAVIQPNYRGSGGFGYQFERSGYRRWYLEMQDDVTDATLWAFEEGIADPNRTCIYGGSYGGFATMAGVTKEPDLYACGFAFVGVYDLEIFLTRGDIPDRESGRTYLTQAIGRDKADLQARSPANHVDKIKAALYVAHGKADQRVPVVQYYNLLEKLDEAEIEYDSMLVSREGHGFYKLENRVKYYNALLDFLNKTIGPDGPGKERLHAGL